MRSSGVTRPVPRASDGTSGRSVEAGVARQAQHRPAADQLLQLRGGGVVRFERAPRAASARRIRAVAVGRHSRPPFGIAGRGHAIEVRQHRHRREAVRQRRRVDERLERRSRLAPAARRAVERALAVVRCRRPSRGCRRCVGSIATSAASSGGSPRVPSRWTPADTRARRRPAAPEGTRCAPASRADGRRRTGCGTAGADSPSPSPRADRRG